MERTITKEYGECTVEIRFGAKNSDLKENVLWLLMEEYCERVSADLGDLARSHKRNEESKKQQERF